MSDFAYPLHEECGVFGIYDRAGTEDVAAAAYSDRKSTRLNSSHASKSRMPSSA